MGNTFFLLQSLAKRDKTIYRYYDANMYYQHSA